MSRIVGLAGVSYGGSTILNFMLGACPNVVALGETHWIVDRNQTCFSHGPGCAQFPDSELEKLRRDPKNWWVKLANLAKNPTILVSSDKNYDYWKQFGCPDIALIPFKPPNELLHSYVKRGFAPSFAKELAARLSTLLEVLHNVPLYAVPYVDVIADPGSMLRKICTVIGAQYIEQAVTPVPGQQCYFGGNPPLLAQRLHRIEITPQMGDVPHYDEAEYLQEIYARFHALSLGSK